MRPASKWYLSTLFFSFTFLIFSSYGLAQTTTQQPAPTQTVPAQVAPTQPAPQQSVPAADEPNSQTQQPATNNAPTTPTTNNDPGQPVPQDQQPTGDQPAAQAPSADDQGSMFVFKKQVEEVVLHATVIDDQRNLVPGLDKTAFSVFENGVPQDITSFRREDVPVALGIVVDNSGSMRDKREKVSQAVLNLVRSSNLKDEVFVVNFGENPYLDQDFTSDVNLLQAALHQVSAKGSTALYDAVVASSKHLKSDAHLEKRVLLVITDGQDNMSQETLQEASRKLEQANGPTVYAIGLLGGGMQRTGRDALQRLAEDTGGVAYFPQTLDQVDSITRTIAHDIRSQYMIAYRPKNQNTRPEFQSVRVEAHAAGYKNLTVRTKSGYYQPEK
jgi:Ca-activated chloride channel homolog